MNQEWRRFRIGGLAAPSDDRVTMLELLMGVGVLLFMIGSLGVIMQVEHLTKTPLILVGRMWPGLIAWVAQA